MYRIHCHRSLLHYALLVVVALGVLFQPVLGAVAELHDIEHTVAAQSDHGHGHHDGHDDPIGGEDESGDPVGVHNLLHDAVFASSMALLDPALRLMSPIAPGNPPACFHSPGPPIAPLTLPFRPPIA